MSLTVQVEGIERIGKGLRKFGREIKLGLQGAAAEAAVLVVSSKGLMNYPPATEANMPGRYSLKTKQRMAYYRRGEGTQVPTKGGGYRSLGNSERYGSQFYYRRTGYGTVIGNRASYAPWLAGENQSKAMEKIGWRKLIDVAQEKLPQIVEIYNRWVARILKATGL